MLSMRARSVPIASFVNLRRRGVSIRAAIVALLAWIGLSAIAVVMSLRLTFAYAWMWAHSEQQSIQNPPSAAALMAMTLAGPLFLSGCGVVLHRYVQSGTASAAR